MEFLTNPYIAFFLIIALGLILGSVKIKGISLDISAIIFAALLFGHFGVKLPDIIKHIGLVFFIYSVGIQAGPGFFESFKRQGKQLIIITLVIILSAAGTALGLAYIFNIDFKISAGLFTGAITSTPGLAAAIEATKSELASIGYGIAYLFGTVGVILFARLSPKIFKIDVKKEEDDYIKELQKDYPQLVNKNFIVENPNIAKKTIGEIKFRTVTGTNISRVLHNGSSFTPESKTVLHKGDIIKAVGTLENLKNTELFVGRQTTTEIPLTKKYSIKKLLVTNKYVVNKSLGELGIFTSYNATATSIRRAGIDITPNPNTKLRFGDKVTVAASEGSVKEISKLLGDSQQKFSELDFLPVSIGILLGILIGKITFPILGLNISLGVTGGVLISALVLSKIGKTGQLLWNVSGEGNQLLRKIGLIFFLAVVGTNAGEHLMTTIIDNGSKLFIIGAVITIIPMFLSVIIGRYVLKLNFLTLIGALVGSMTSTPALSALEPVTDSNAPHVAYATVYPFALVLIIIISQIFGIL